MNKFFIVIFLAIFSMNSKAEWALIDETDNYFVYIDKESITSISSNGNVVKIAKMWSLIDYKLNNLAALSEIYYHEYDCQNKRTNVLSTNRYIKHMGKGMSYDTQQYNFRNWQYIPPGSTSELNWKIACGKK